MYVPNMADAIFSYLSAATAGSISATAGGVYPACPPLAPACINVIYRLTADRRKSYIRRSIRLAPISIYLAFFSIPWGQAIMYVALPSCCSGISSCYSSSFCRCRPTTKCISNTTNLRQQDREGGRKREKTSPSSRPALRLPYLSICCCCCCYYQRDTARRRTKKRHAGEHFRGASTDGTPRSKRTRRTRHPLTTHHCHYNHHLQTKSNQLLPPGRGAGRGAQKNAQKAKVKARITTKGTQTTEVCMHLAPCREAKTSRYYRKPLSFRETAACSPKIWQCIPPRNREGKLWGGA